MKDKQSSDGTRLTEKVAAQSMAPVAPLTTSRRLNKQLKRFEKKLAQHKEHEVVQDLWNEFTMIKQAMLDVKNSQYNNTSGLKVSEPVPVLRHHLPEEFLVKHPPALCYRIVPTQASNISRVPYVHPSDGKLSPRDPHSPPTLEAARDHLLWKHNPIPLISVFKKRQRALRWAAMLQVKHKEVQFVLAEIDASSLRSRVLYDATKLARYLGIPDWRVAFHRGEYFWLGAIDSRYIARKSPINLGARLKQPTNDGMVKSFKLMDREARRYASDAGNKRRSRKASPQNLERSQAVMGSELDNERYDSIIEDVGPVSAEHIRSHQTANEFQRAMSEPRVLPTAQPSVERRLSGPDSLSTLPEAPKRAEAQDIVDESGQKPAHALAREGEADIVKLHRDDIPIFAQSARRGKPIIFDTLDPALKSQRKPHAPNGQRGPPIATPSGAIAGAGSETIDMSFNPPISVKQLKRWTHRSLHQHILETRVVRPDFCEWEVGSVLATDFSRQCAKIEQLRSTGPPQAGKAVTAYIVTDELLAFIQWRRKFTTAPSTAQIS